MVILVMLTVIMLTLIYAGCGGAFIVMLSVLMLNVDMLSVVAPNSVDAEASLYLLKKAST